MSLLSGLVACYEWNDPLTQPNYNGDLTGNYLASGTTGFGSPLATVVSGTGVFDKAIIFTNAAGAGYWTAITEPLTEFTVAIWFKVLGTAPLVIAERLVDRDYATGFWTGSAVGDGSGLSWGGGVNYNANSTFNFGIYLTLSVGWHQLVSRFNAAPGGGGMHSIIADGGAQSTSIGVGAGPASTAGISIGADVTGGAQNHDTPIAQTAIWRRPLTNSEIAEHCNNGRGVRYPFNVRRMGRPLGSRIIAP